MALAFYIEYPRISAVEVGGSSKKPRIKKVHVGDLPEPRNDDGSPVVDKQGWLNQEVASFCKENGLSGKAYLLVGPDGMRYRDMKLAFSDKRQIDKVLQYQVEGLIPSTPIEELALGYEILHSDENGSKLLVQAADREYIRERITALEEAGLSIAAADSHLSGTLNLGLLHFELSAGTGSMLWVDFAGTTATVSLVDDGEVRSSRVFMSPYLAGATGVTAQAHNAKDAAQELANEARARAIEFDDSLPDNDSEAAPGAESVYVLAENDSVNIGADAVADRIEHMSQEQLGKFISRVAAEARRTMYSNNISEEPQRLVISGLGAAGDSLVSRLGNELSISDFRSIDLMETVNLRGKDLSSSLDIPDIGELSYLTGTALKGVGRDYSGIDFRTGSLAAGTTYDYARTPLAFTATFALLFSGLMFLFAFTNANSLEKDISRLVEKSASNTSHETPYESFNKAYLYDLTKSKKSKLRDAAAAVVNSKNGRPKKEQRDMTYLVIEGNPTAEINSTYDKLNRQIKRLKGDKEGADLAKPHPRDNILKLVLTTIQSAKPSYEFALTKIDIGKSSLTVEMYVSESPKDKKEHGGIGEDSRMITAFKKMVAEHKVKVAAEKNPKNKIKLDWFEDIVKPSPGAKSVSGPKGRTARMLTLKIDLKKDPKFENKKTARKNASS